MITSIEINSDTMESRSYAWYGEELINCMVQLQMRVYI